jgi:hypothetical protein
MRVASGASALAVPVLYVPIGFKVVVSPSSIRIGSRYDALPFTTRGIGKHRAEVIICIAHTGGPPCQLLQITARRYEQPAPRVHVALAWGPATICPKTARQTGEVYALRYALTRDGLRSIAR